MDQHSGRTVAVALAVAAGVFWSGAAPAQTTVKIGIGTQDTTTNTVVATIGPVTAEAAIQLGIPVAVQPTVSTIPALVDAIAAHVSRGRFVST